MSDAAVALSVVAENSKGEATNMHERPHLDREEGNRNARESSVPWSHEEVSRLKPGCTALISLADRLEAFADDIHTSGRAEQAQHLVNCLRSDIIGHLDAEAAVLGAVGTVQDAVLAAAIQRSQSEHAATRQLISPVIRGLRSIRRDSLPGRLTDFVIDTVVLCEFLRLHARFKLETLYPLLARLEPHEAEPARNRMRERHKSQECQPEPEAAHLRDRSLAVAPVEMGLEELLLDRTIQLLMRSDGVPGPDIRDLFSHPPKRNLYFVKSE